MYLYTKCAFKPPFRTSYLKKQTVLASLDKNKPIQEILNVTFLFSTAQDGRTTPIRAHKKRQKVVLAVQ